MGEGGNGGRVLHGTVEVITRNAMQERGGEVIELLIGVFAKQ